MKIILGADHGGYRLKEQLQTWLTNAGYEVVDIGADVLDPDDDYPAVAFEVAEAVVSAAETGEDTIGILVCRSGGGMTIAANKVPGARAVTVTNSEEVRHARNDNDANIMALPGDWITTESAEELVQRFIETPFSDAPRHSRRVQQIHEYAKRYSSK